MKPIFARGLPLQVCLILTVIFSLLLLVARHQIEPIRNSLSSVLSPIQCIANTPADMAHRVSQWLNQKAYLEQQNHELLHQQLLMSERLQKFEHIHQENLRLRSLLGSQVRLDARKVVTEVMAVASDPYHHYIVLQVGHIDGIYEGQTVIDSKGIIGQVTQVSALTSRVLLISDVHHAIPVRIARSDVRSIAYGTGDVDEIELKHLPVSTDVKVGDLIVSSGLGGRFPEGYPVARIHKVERDSHHRYAVVSAKPVAALDRVRYLLLLWPGASHVLKTEKPSLQKVIPSPNLPKVFVQPDIVKKPKPMIKTKKPSQKPEAQVKKEIPKAQPKAVTPIEKKPNVQVPKPPAPIRLPKTTSEPESLEVSQ